MQKTLLFSLLFSFSLFLSQHACAKKIPSMEEMWDIIQKQQATIEQLKKQVEQTSVKINSQAESSEQTHQALAILSDSIDEQTSSNQSKYKVGGYGELHYANTDKGNSIDFHRFVMFTGYDFTDNTRFYSELEVEHALSGGGGPGQVEVEQAFIEHRLNNRMKITAGISLLPVGILNETHEPNTFYGVERNTIEKNIIPTTWWAAGLGLSHQPSTTFGYDVFVGEGLNVPISGANAFIIRKGRQKSAQANASKGAVTARIRLNPMTNLQLNASMQYQQDITQGALGVSATLVEANATYTFNNFTLKALYARWDLDDKVKLLASGREQQSGFYLEPSYRFGEHNQFGVFARYSSWDNAAGVANFDTEIRQSDVGFNFWLTPLVVFKINYQDQAGAASDDGLFLGMGYSF